MFKSFGIAILSIAIILGLDGCGNSEPSVLPGSASATKKVAPDFSSVETVGNHSYLPINRGVNADSMASEILRMLDAFEKFHPELKVTSWSIEKQQDAYLTGRYVYGLWVNHEPIGNGS